MGEISFGDKDEKREYLYLVCEKNKQIMSDIVCIQSVYMVLIYLFVSVKCQSHLDINSL